MAPFVYGSGVKKNKKKNSFNHFETCCICPGCMKNFSCGKIRGIFKDVVECLSCGEIFVTDEANLERFDIDLNYYLCYGEGVF